MKLLRSLIIVGVLLAVAGAVEVSAQDNGAPPIGPTRAVLPVDGSWNLFCWNAGIGSLNLFGPFTFDGPAQLDVTDAFLDGDMFDILDGGISVGMTSAPTDTGASILGDADAAFASPNWSSGSAVLAAGPHSITLQVTRIATGQTTGCGYLRAVPMTPVAPGWMLALLALALVAGGTWMLRRFRGAESTASWLS